MNPEEIQALKELIEFLQEKKVGEFRLERGELKMELKFEAAIAAEAGKQFPSQSPYPSIDPLLLARLLGAGAAQSAPADVSTPAPGSAQGPGPLPAADLEETLHMVKSPIVGTFYGAPSPGSPAFVKVGDHVEAGQALCIVEAMKLMNEIESDAAGEVVKCLVQNGQPIEYGQPLFALRPR
jgi:acetyl-CoA carboxylase biotin carboxyl carrier protein